MDMYALKNIIIMDTTYLVYPSLVVRYLHPSFTIAERLIIFNYLFSLSSYKPSDDPDIVLITPIYTIVNLPTLPVSFCYPDGDHIYRYIKNRLDTDPEFQFLRNGEKARVNEVVIQCDVVDPTTNTIVDTFKYVQS